MSPFIPITIILFILLIIFIALYFTKKCDQCVCPECEECPCPLDGTIGSVVLPIPDENRSTTLKYPYIKKLDSNMVLYVLLIIIMTLSQIVGFV
jgi:hypothetical protein